jgi:hypothetical protein
MVLGLIAAAGLVPSAAISLFIQPGHHPEVTALALATFVVVLVVGFPIGLYTPPWDTR